jgi:hypothetical protein
VLIIVVVAVAWEEERGGGWGHVRGQAGCRSRLQEQVGRSKANAWQVVNAVSFCVIKDMQCQMLSDCHLGCLSTAQRASGQHKNPRGCMSTHHRCTAWGTRLRGPGDR